MKTLKNTLALLLISLFIMSCETESVEETMESTSFLIELSELEAEEEIDAVDEKDDAQQRSDDEDDMPGKDSDDEDDMPGKDSDDEDDMPGKDSDDEDDMPGRTN